MIKTSLESFTTSFLGTAKNNNVGVMLSGWGGDQIVTTTRSGFSESLASKKMFGKLWSEINQRHRFPKSFLTFLKYSYKSLKTPLDKTVKEFATNATAQSGYKKELIKKFNLNQQIDAYGKAKLETDLKSYQKKVMFAGPSIERTENHGLIGKHFKVDYRFPMLDVPLLEFVHQLPIEVVAPEGRSRHLFKNLMKGKIPDKIVNSPKARIPTVPFAFNFFEKNKEFIVERMELLNKNENTTLYFDFTVHNFKNKINNTFRKVQLLNKIKK